MWEANETKSFEAEVAACMAAPAGQPRGATASEPAWAKEGLTCKVAMGKRQVLGFQRQ